MSTKELEERTMTISVSVVFSAFIIMCTVVIFALICLNYNQIEKRKNTKIQVDQKNTQGETNSLREGIYTRRGK
jgi:hypothetical protein